MNKDLQIELLKKDVSFKDKEIDKLNNIIEEKNYLYNKLSTESEYVINKLNKIINRMEKDLEEMYITFGEFSEEYTKKKIQELKEGK